MNSLSELNNYNQTFPLNFTDERASQIIFDRVTPVNANVYMTNDGNHQLPLGIDIEDIVQGDLLNIRLEVDLTNLPNTDLEWGTLPSGITTSVVGRVYTASGIATMEQWTAIKHPTITGSVLNYGAYIYASAIKYQVTGNKSWTITINISSSAELPADYTLYNNPVKIRPKNGDLYADSTFDTIINGNSIRDNSILLVSEYSLSAKWGIYYRLNSEYSISLSNPLTSYYLLDAVRSGDTYSTNTATTISGGSLISHDYPTFEGQNHQIDIIPSVVNAISNLDVPIFRYKNRINAFDGSSNDLFGDEALAISKDGNTLAVGSQKNGSTSVNGSVYIYIYNNNNWEYQTTLTIPRNNNPTGLFGIQSISLSNDGNTLAIGTPYEYGLGDENEAGAFSIYIRSGTTWSFQQKVRLSTGFERFGYNVSLSNDGNTLGVGTFNNNTVGKSYIYIRTGTTWSQQIFKTGSTNVTISIVSGDGNTASLGNTTYFRTGTTWTAQNLTNVITSYSDNGNIAVNSTSIYIRSGNTWSLQQTLPSSGGCLLSSNGNILIRNRNVYIKNGSNWILQTTIPLYGTYTSYTSICLSGDGLKLLYGQGWDDPDGISNKGSVYNFIYDIIYSFNNTTKVLTLTGTKETINSYIDNIQFTPATGYTSNFTLQYRYYEPGSTTKYVYRTQNITHV